MGVALVKGGNVSLTARAPGLTSVVVGLGWDLVRTGTAFELDAAAMLVDRSGQVLSDAHVVFFAHRTSPDGSVHHAGSHLLGTGDGDDEQIEVHLDAVPAEAARVVFPVAIYDAHRRRQSFGQVRAAHVRVVDRVGGTELARYDLSSDAATETAMIFGELYRARDHWKFRAVGQGWDSGLRGIAAEHGVHVG